MIASNGRQHQEVFNGSVLSERFSEIPFQRGGPFRRIRSLEGGITPPALNEVVGANLNRARSARATPPSDGLCSIMPTPSSSSLLDGDVLVEDLKRSASMYARLERLAPAWGPVLVVRVPHAGSTSALTTTDTARSGAPVGWWPR